MTDPKQADDFVRLCRCMHQRAYHQLWDGACNDCLCESYDASGEIKRYAPRPSPDAEIWMNAVADAVEPLGYDRRAACGPDDLLPGLKTLAYLAYEASWEEIRVLRNDIVVLAAMRPEPEFDL